MENVISLMFLGFFILGFIVIIRTMVIRFDIEDLQREIKYMKKDNERLEKYLERTLYK